MAIECDPTSKTNSSQQHNHTHTNEYGLPKYWVVYWNGVKKPLTRVFSPGQRFSESELQVETARRFSHMALPAFDDARLLCLFASFLASTQIALPSSVVYEDGNSDGKAQMYPLCPPPSLN
jgi:hypothetical protein